MGAIRSFLREWLGIEQERVKIAFKLLEPGAQLPRKASHERDYAKTGDTGYDVFCTEGVTIFPRSSAVVPTGIQVAYISPGYWFRAEARSGLGFKHGIQPHFGVIDNPYRGILTVKLYNFSDTPYEVKPGDKVCQIVVYPLITANIFEMDVVGVTSRGEGRLGSTGR